MTLTVNGEVIPSGQKVSIGKWYFVVDDTGIAYVTSPDGITTQGCRFNLLIPDFSKSEFEFA